ncbi:hypothetical protein [Hyphomicrobium sp.]|nr:hypothetical protein [Hyphomicrobium sp.]MBY0560442.1 hypothetical protein [Hyphomicrobium sp.]
MAHSKRGFADFAERIELGIATKFFLGGEPVPRRTSAKQPDRPAPFEA